MMLMLCGSTYKLVVTHKTHSLHVISYTVVLVTLIGVLHAFAELAIGLNLMIPPPLLQP